MSSQVCFQAAEKRKKLLDELAIKSQEDSDTYKSKISQRDTAHNEEIDSLRSKSEQKTIELTQLLEMEKVLGA